MSPTSFCLLRFGDERPPPTGFDRYFEQRMKDPTFAAQYHETRTEIDATDKLIRALEMAREHAAV